ncbi:tRNA threonylcarbamoyladenosine dehydratase [Methylotenera sp. N17]|uniref:tRNA threonylcarbamoyladenosine dehydratase n=1 Tax=Methylotenera sp. N17 TaxID=1502761 RepID=UPI0006490EA0|nr:tRNA threonylcarbamoyladenosine dehydratase [Methylotenera sp. N17]
MQSNLPDYERRFGGVRRLYGAAGFDKLQAAHVCVIGMGGVGSWAVEALARNAIGTLTLIDLDNIAESNVNRQLHAVDDAFGLPKVTAMQQRVKMINPACEVHTIEDFITPDNIAALLGQGFDVIVDCIDDAKAKVALAALCKQQQQPLVMVGSAGGRLDPTRIQVDDLAYVTGDRLLAKVRNQLRRDFAFPKASNTKKSAKFGVLAIFSDEPALKPIQVEGAGCEINPISSTSITGLNCAGYGSSVCVTAPFGFTAAQYALNHIVKP